MRFLPLLIFLAFSSYARNADAQAVWHSGNITYRYAPATRDMTLTQAGKTLRLLAGFGPRFLIKGKEQPLADTTVKLLASVKQGAGFAFRYSVKRDGERADYTVEIGPAAGGLKIRVHSNSTQCGRITAGRTITDRRWYRIS